ncbi:hypothetical protein L7F22_059113 [Adiantum nelumboides]|nr:hypothetical protein [Adiantum nelumboides]
MAPRSTMCSMRTTWMHKLVSVTPRVIAFRLSKTGKGAISELLYRWQAVAPKAPLELFSAVYVAGFTTGNVTDVQASFYGKYLGTTVETLAPMGKIYPELGLSTMDCKEGKWIEAVAFIAEVEVKDLKSRNNRDKGYFRAKSDYVRVAISKEGIKGALAKLEENAGKGYFIIDPYGGIIDTIGAGAIAFPHRAGTLYNIQFIAAWPGDAQGTQDAAPIEWIRNLYAYMARFVSHSPRVVNVNYIDLDLGTSSSYAQAKSSWGQSYFLSNFASLAHIKAQFDPFNVFSHPQSIPPS